FLEHTFHRAKERGASEMSQGDSRITADSSPAHRGCICSSSSAESGKPRRRMPPPSIRSLNLQIWKVTSPALQPQRPDLRQGRAEGRSSFSHPTEEPAVAST